MPARRGDCRWRGPPPGGAACRRTMRRGSDGALLMAALVLREGAETAKPGLGRPEKVLSCKRLWLQ
jgi:hypothetical protein